MDSNLGLLKFLVPQIPSLANTALWHTLGSTPTSSKWDLRSALTVQVLRQMMSPPKGKPVSIAKTQATTLKDPGVKGKTWVATETIRAPQPNDESMREAVFKAIDDLRTRTDELVYTKPNLVDIQVEWTGFRPSAGKDEPLPDISEEEKYARLMAEPTRTSNTTTLYFHGGAYYLCDPSTHRASCSRLAKETNGRVCSVRYRLAPQAAFPSQLLDALLVYLSLLYPPPGSMHAAIPAKDILFGGDSAGGNLSFALLQFLLHLHRQSKSPTLLFHGKQVPIPLPAGVTALSAWLDVTLSMPSVTKNAQYDYLPAPSTDDSQSRFRPDSIWPTTPPRGDIFTDLSMLDHPLVSLVTAESWAGAPPLYMCTGEEMLLDEQLFVASRAAQQGVTVQFEEYEAMPHVFPALLPTAPGSDDAMRAWGEFCRRCTEEPGNLEPMAKFVKAKTLEVRVLEGEKLTDLTLEEVRNLIKETKTRRMKGIEREGKGMPKPNL